MKTSIKQIGRRPSSHSVEVHEVVEVANLSALPFLSHVRHLKDLLGSRHAYSPVDGIPDS